MQLYAKDFNFNGHNASDFNFILCSFGTDGISEAQDTGFNLELITTTIPSNNRNMLSGINYSDAYVFTVTMIYNECNGSNTDKSYFSYTEVREVENWLSVSKYTKFTIDDLDFSNIYFNVIPTNIQRHKHNGNVIGWTVEFTCDSPFAWEVEEKSVSVSGTINLVLDNTSDDATTKYIFPAIHYSPTSNGTFSIVNKSDNNYTMQIDNMRQNDDLYITDVGVITTASNLNVYNDFNKHFLRLIHGSNSLSIKGNGTIVFTMIYPRKVGM